MAKIEEITKIFTKLFNEHEKKLEENVLKIISSCTKNLHKQIEDLNKNFEKKIQEMEAALNFNIKENEEKVKNLEEKFEKEIEFLKERARKQEDRSRRNNLRVDGVKDNARETWEETEVKVQEILKKIDVKDVKIERAHRVSTKYVPNGKPRTIIFKTLSFKDKERILKSSNKLKNTGLYINEDFSKETIDIRKRNWEKVKEYRQQGKFAALSYDKIIVRNFRS